MLNHISPYPPSFASSQRILDGWRHRISLDKAIETVSRDSNWKLTSRVVSTESSLYQKNTTTSLGPLFHTVQAQKISSADAFKTILHTREDTPNKIILAGDRRPTARQPPVGSKCSVTETPGQE